MSTLSVETMVQSNRRPVSAAADVRARATSRLLFVDNIRVLLAILVILFHLMITYAGTGDWYYSEGREDTITAVLGAPAAFLSRKAYTAYLIHKTVIVVMAYAARGVEVYPLLKWALVSLVALPLCFGPSGLIRKLPYADRVL